MRQLVIIGAGGHGKVVADTAECMGCWQQVIFIDQKFPELDSCGAWPVVSSNLSKFLPAEVQIIVAIGDNKIRNNVCEQVVSDGYSLATVIHPSAVVSQYAKVEVGSLVCANAVINSDASVGKYAIVNTSATIDHDCKLGLAVHISPGAHVAGEVNIGDYSWLGTGVSTKQALSIGRNVVVGVGAVVVCDLSANEVYVGSPAKLLNKSIKVELR